MCYLNFKTRFTFNLISGSNVFSILINWTLSNWRKVTKESCFGKLLLERTITDPWFNVSNLYIAAVNMLCSRRNKVSRHVASLDRFHWRHVMVRLFFPAYFSAIFSMFRQKYTESQNLRATERLVAKLYGN